MTTVHAHSMRDHARASLALARFLARNEEKDVTVPGALKIRRHTGRGWRPFVRNRIVIPIAMSYQPDFPRYDFIQGQATPSRKKMFPAGTLD
ncbi:hypothetical protein PT277_08500 [Acetobacteraceae bacterium ESL0709]|nr:hypothetical protein [Acetobacteraceae bacterium ESL0697]MDF7678722.1 hypothetical protein [Acetobacteraceae bacterium ESL0709]